MENKKIIIDLCGGTGAWSKPYKDAGFDVRVITFPKYDVNKFDLGNSWITFFSANGGDDMRIQYSDIYGILAAPTCTQFSLARTTAKTPRNFRSGMQLVESCLRIIWEVKIRGGQLRFWALENPMGYLRQFLGKPPLTFNPCDYGDPYTKRTDLWGYYNLPKQRPIPLADQQMRDCSINNRALPRIPEDYEMPGDIRPQAVRRSITSSKFAEAFYKANK